jgi:hypothetical protein
MFLRISVALLLSSQNPGLTKAAFPQQLSFSGYRRQRNLLIPATRDRISFIFSTVIAGKDN